MFVLFLMHAVWHFIDRLLIKSRWKRFSVSITLCIYSCHDLIFLFYTSETVWNFLILGNKYFDVSSFFNLRKKSIFLAKFHFQISLEATNIHSSKKNIGVEVWCKIYNMNCWKKSITFLVYLEVYPSWTSCFRAFLCCVIVALENG